MLPRPGHFTNLKIKATYKDTVKAQTDNGEIVYSEDRTVATYKGLIFDGEPIDLVKYNGKVTEITLDNGDEQITLSDPIIEDIGGLIKISGTVKH